MCNRSVITGCTRRLVTNSYSVVIERTVFTAGALATTNVKPKLTHLANIIRAHCFVITITYIQSEVKVLCYYKKSTLHCQELGGNVCFLI